MVCGVSVPLEYGLDRGVTDAGSSTATMALLVLRTREDRRVSGAAQSAFREPRWGVPMKAMPKVEERSAFTCSWDVSRDIRRACSTTRPPREWATKIAGRLLYRQLANKAVLDL